jgi:hypothetical protein
MSPQTVGQSPGQLQSFSNGALQVPLGQVAGQSAGQLPLSSPSVQRPSPHRLSQSPPEATLQFCAVSPGPVQQPSPHEALGQSAGQVHTVSPRRGSQVPLPQLVQWFTGTASQVSGTVQAQSASLAQFWPVGVPEMTTTQHPSEAATAQSWGQVQGFSCGPSHTKSPLQS